MKTKRAVPTAIDPVANLSIGVDARETRRASTWLGEEGSARGMPEDPLWRLDMCLTEALANVIAHGGAGARANPVRLRLDVRGSASGGVASLTVSDAGTAFDPVKVPPREPARTLAEAEPGGQGLMLLRRFADAIDYSYRDGQNHLTIQVRWNQEAAS